MAACLKTPSLCRQPRDRGLFHRFASYRLRSLAIFRPSWNPDPTNRPYRAEALFSDIVQNFVVHSTHLQGYHWL